MMSPCPSPRHAMRRRTGATPPTILRVPRASRFDSGRFDSGRFESGDDIGEQLVLAPPDLAAPLPIILLVPGELELVGHRVRMRVGDGRSGSVRVELASRRISKKKTRKIRQ